MNTDLISYYRDRAAEYEKVYDKPERQEELLLVAKFLQDVFRDKSVLEVACGTGYWTQRIAETALSVFATDINGAVLDIAKAKRYRNRNVTFETADLFHLSGNHACDSLFGGFIWSHIGLQQLPDFIDRVNRLAGAGSTVVFVDNNFVEGSSLPITDSDNWGNAYQTRALEDGTQHRVMKNFPPERTLREAIAGKSCDVRLNSFDYYWILAYDVCQPNNLG